MFTPVIVCAVDPVPLRIGPHRDVTIIPLEGGVSEIVVTGATPHLWSAPVEAGFNPDKHTVVGFEYFSPSGIGSISLRYRQSDGGMTFAGEAPLPTAETWVPFSIDFTDVVPAPPKADSRFRFHLAFANRAGSSLRIRSFSVRAPNEAERSAKAMREVRHDERETDAGIILTHLRAEYAGEIREVSVGEEVIHIRGNAGEGLVVRELLLHEPSHLSGRNPSVGTDLKGEFSIEIPRFDGVRDRALSRWRLDHPDGRPASRARWFDFVEPDVASDLPRLSAPHQKGLGGIPPITDPNHEIFELGIGHATVNIVVSSLVAGTKRPGFEAFQLDGREWFANERALRSLETTVRLLNDKKILVSGILLVGNHTGQPMTHPEAEARGVYSMPNLAEVEGAATYRAAIHLLADRFSRPDTRIVNWILHNEIDQAGVWTNMGDQPLARYLETYLRSARVVYHSTRLRDPHARVFVSLTHHWTKPSSGSGTYTVRNLLELFNEMATAEGDFEWGVAYHPYPRDLRNPDTWRDPDVTADFETPYVTPRNLEVLPAYLSQLRFLYLGKTPRAILFSEQGFNTPTLSEIDQKRQVAALIYTFRKLKTMAVVEAWHLHRYQDMPEGEGGLRLGIIDEHGNRKLGWGAYSAIGSDREAEYDSLADEVIRTP